MKKKIFSVLLVLAMLAALPITAFANLDVKAIYTASSSFAVGGTASVDEAATCAAVMDLPNIDAALYNAALERSVEYRWVCAADEQPPRSGKSITWTEEDIGKEFYCQLFFYNNGEYVDFVNGERREITGSKTEFKVLTTQLPAAIVGQKYSAQLKASEEDAKFEEDRYSQLSEFGLTLSKSGVISGTPTKAGNCHVNLIARVQGSEATANLDITVTESTRDAPKILTEELPAAFVGVAYSFKLECSDGDAEFGEYYNPGKANDLGKTGLILTQHGELEGTPEKEGSYTFWIQAIGEGGEDYKAYTLTVKAADLQPTDSTEQPTDPTEQPADPTEQPTDPAKTDEPKTDKPADTAPTVDGGKDGDSSILLFVGMGLGVLVAGVAAAVVIIIAKKKK